MPKKNLYNTDYSDVPKKLHPGIGSGKSIVPFRRNQIVDIINKAPRALSCNEIRIAIYRQDGTETAKGGVAKTLRTALALGLIAQPGRGKYTSVKNPKS